MRERTGIFARVFLLVEKYSANMLPFKDTSSLHISTRNLFHAHTQICRLQRRVRRLLIPLLNCANTKDVHMEGYDIGVANVPRIQLLLQLTIQPNRTLPNFRYRPRELDLQHMLSFNLICGSLTPPLASSAHKRAVLRENSAITSRSTTPDPPSPTDGRTCVISQAAIEASRNRTI